MSAMHQNLSGLGNTAGILHTFIDQLATVVVT